MTDLLIKKENFDTIMNGKKVSLFTLQNKNGIAVQVTNYGAYLISVIAPDKNGIYGDVIAGYDKISNLVKDNMFMGCVVGPVANRIAGGEFTLDGKQYKLFTGDQKNSLHSKPDGFNTEIFETIQEGNKVTMTLNVPDMKTGFPGNKKVTVIYELKPDNTLRMILRMTSDKKTICNMTNHAYFNLSGDATKTILNHLLKVNADSITPINAELIPSGEIMKVKNTPFDFNELTAIGKRIDEDNDLLRYGGGYDNNYVLDKKYGEYGFALQLIDPDSKRSLKIYTNQPAIQVYTANFDEWSVPGKNGKLHKFRCSVALEPQKYPDAPHHDNFPSIVLNAGEVYEHVTDYVFGVEK